MNEKNCNFSLGYEQKIFSKPLGFRLEESKVIMLIYLQILFVHLFFFDLFAIIPTVVYRVLVLVDCKK